MNIDAVIIVVYFCGMLGCGILGMRLAKSREHFAVAGRTLNFWLYFPCLSTVLIGGGATFGAARLDRHHVRSGPDDHGRAAFLPTGQSARAEHQ